MFRIEKGKENKMKYTEFRKMVIEEYEEYLEFQNIKKQNAKEREEEVKRDIEEFDGPYIEREIEKITAPKKKSSEEIQMMNIKAIDDWIQLGGLINSDNDANGNYILFVEGSEEFYYDWIKEDKLEDTTLNQKEFCKAALENANVPDEVIEELLSNWL